MYKKFVQPLGISEWTQVYKVDLNRNVLLQNAGCKAKAASFDCR